MEVPDTVSRDHTITDPANADPSFDDLGNKFFKTTKNNLKEVFETMCGTVPNKYKNPIQLTIIVKFRFAFNLDNET